MDLLNSKPPGQRDFVCETVAYPGITLTPSETSYIQRGYEEGDEKLTPVEMDIGHRMFEQLHSGALTTSWASVKEEEGTKELNNLSREGPTTVVLSVGTNDRARRIPLRPGKHPLTGIYTRGFLPSLDSLVSHVLSSYQPTIRNLILIPPFPFVHHPSYKAGVSQIEEEEEKDGYVTALMKWKEDFRMREDAEEWEHLKIEVMELSIALKREDCYDGLHPTEQGYRKLASEFKERLDKFL
ncbi:hypothetical protein BT69DRAFT_359472 [Atractiella rhizophila]|nr:hypothetical protein BT69DRAFT_359472 [Atractiella rhizophila]